jgi:hypothetical protein
LLIFEVEYAAIGAWTLLGMFSLILCELGALARLAAPFPWARFRTKEADTIRRRIESILSWKQVVANLKEFMPEGIRINQITAGHAIEFHEKLKAWGMATTTIHKRIQFESLSRFS